MKENVKEIKIKGKEAARFCAKLGIHCNKFWITKLENTTMFGKYIDNGFWYRVEDGVMIVVEDSKKNRFSGEMHVTRKRGAYGLELIIKDGTVQGESDKCINDTQSEHPDTRFKVTTVYRHSDGTISVPNSTPEKEDIVRELYTGVDVKNTSKSTSKKEKITREQPLNTNGVAVPKSPQNSGTVQYIKPKNDDNSTPVRIYNIKELQEPLVFTKRKVHSEYVYEVKIEYTLNNQALRTQLINYCVAMLKYTKTDEELDFIESKLFEDGFIYEDFVLNSSITMAHIQAHQFMMKNKATHIQVLEVKSPSVNQNSAWGNNFGTMYKNLFRLKLTLVSKEVK